MHLIVSVVSVIVAIAALWYLFWPYLKDGEKLELQPLMLFVGAIVLVILGVTLFVCWHYGYHSDLLLVVTTIVASFIFAFLWAELGY